MRHLNLDQIRTLIEVADCGSFTAAARNLNLTQPAVTLQVQELESRLNVKLIERGKRTTVTPAGKHLVELGKRLLEQSVEAQQLMRRHSEGWLGRVRIGMSMTLLIFAMPPVMIHLRRKYPSLELSIKTGFTENTIERLLDNELDIGLCTGPVSEKLLVASPLTPDPFVAILPPSAKKAPAEVTPTDLLQWPLVMGNPRSAMRRIITEWIGEDADELRPVMELDNVAGIKSVVAAGLGASIIPRLAIGSKYQQDGLVVRPLSPSIDRTLMLVQRKDKAGDPAIAHVTQTLISHLGTAH